MPLYLTLIRHAKSSWETGDTFDHERTLNTRGEHDAPLMGAHLNKTGWQPHDQARWPLPDFWLCSTAIRTRRTAELLAAAQDAKPAVTYRRDLYHAHAREMLGLMQSFAPEVKHAVFIGHNPGLEDLASFLLPRKNSVGEMPTCGVLQLQLEADAWKEVNEDCATLGVFWKPRELFYQV